MNLFKKSLLDCGNRCGCSELGGRKRCSAEEDCCTCAPCRMCDQCVPKGTCGTGVGRTRKVDETCIANSTAPFLPGDHQNVT